MSNSTKSLLNTMAIGACAVVLLGAVTAPAMAQIQVQPTQPLRPTALEDVATSNLPSAEELRSVRIEPRLVDLTEKLGSSVFADREQAMAELTSGEVDLNQLLAVLYQRPLELEQKHRLTAAVQQRILNIPRGAVGISMNPFLAATGEIEIKDLIPGLPAEELLKIGDRIFEIDKQPLHGTETLLWRVQSKRPGDTIEMRIRRVKRNDKGQVLRDPDELPLYEELAISLELGSADLLDPWNTARTRRTNAVIESRRLEAETATSLYGPRARQLAIDLTLPEQERVEERLVTDRTVAMHPAILSIRKQQERITQDRALHFSEQIRNQWRKRLEQLVADACETGLAPEEQQYRERVATLYRTLLETAPLHTETEAPRK